MGKKRKSLTKEEIDVIAQYQWANITDIMNIGALVEIKQEMYLM